MTAALALSVLGTSSCDKLTSTRQAPRVTLAERTSCHDSVEKSWNANPSAGPGNVGHGSLATSDGRCLLFWHSSEYTEAHSNFWFDIEDVFTHETLASGFDGCTWKDPKDVSKGCQDKEKNVCVFRHTGMECSVVQQRVRAEWPDLYEVVSGIDSWKK